MIPVPRFWQSPDGHISPWYQIHVYQSAIIKTLDSLFFNLDLGAK